MTNPPLINPAPATLEDLIAINREIAALARAGIPLELGLRSFAGGLSSRLGRLADRIADRLTRGESLAAAIEAEGSGLYPVYSAVISAGIQSGQLPEALESVARSAELVKDTRQHLRLSMIYPAAVCVLGFVLFTGFAGLIIPRYLAAADEFGFGGDPMFRFLRRVDAAAPIWIWLTPVLVVAVLIISKLFFRGSLNPFELGYLLRRAQFAELLQIQVAHGLPIGPSFRRAAEGTGDDRLCQIADHVCADMERGVSFSKAVTDEKRLPPLMSWMLATGATQGTLAKSLGLIRDSCHRRVARRSHFLRVWLPALITVVVGGGVTLLYSLIMFLPLRAFWEGIMRE
ncbi:MAG: type II secretion system F family protein [Planctomycetes bacterium]|nr:type II secretion system F family protein [Planctomycetota bacterium]